jgi:hypothetical protein
MEDLVTGFVRVLAWLIPWDMLLFPVRIERLATRKLKQWRAMGEGVFPARVCGLVDFDPLDGFILVTATKVRFSIDLAGRLHPTAITPVSGQTDRIRWGELTGRTVWSRGSLMKFARDDLPESNTDWSMLQVAPAWTLVLEDGLRSAGFAVEGEWPIARSS